MFFIVVGHLFTHGMNDLSAMQFDTHPAVITSNRMLVAYLRVVTSVAVNCYVMITGYFSINSTAFRWEKLTKLWLQIVFYSLGIYLIAHIAASTFSVSGLWDAARPISSNQYWFISTYVALIALAPFLSRLAKGLSQREWKIGLFVLIILSSPLIKNVTFPLPLDRQTAIMWFITLFYAGGYIRLFNPLERFKKYLGMWFILFCFFLMCANVVVYHYIARENWDTGLVLGNSSFTFISSVLFFLWFKYSNFKRNKLTRFFVSIAPFTLGVYLVHDNHNLRGLIWRAVSASDYFGSYAFITYVMVVCMVIFIVCIVIDYIRSKLFKLLRMDILSNKITQSVIWILKRVYASTKQWANKLPQ